VPTTSRPEDTSYRAERPALESVRDWFGEPQLRAGETRTGTVITLPEGNGPWCFKIAGTDAAARPVAAWLVLP
jgi:hypothetical protein